MLKVCILADDRVRKRGILAEHGLSLWIEKDDKSILFDTGQTDVFYHNARKLGIDAGSADFIVLSHGHYDHTGGLACFPNRSKVPPIYVHPDAFLEKYACTDDDEPSRDVGVPFSISDYVWLEEQIIHTARPLEIAEGLWYRGDTLPKPCGRGAKGFYIKKDGK